MPFDQGCLIGMTDQTGGSMNMPAAQTGGCPVTYAGMPAGVIQWDLTAASAVNLLDSGGNPIVFGGTLPTMAELTNCFSLVGASKTGTFNLNLPAIQALSASNPNSYGAIWTGFNQGGQLSMSISVRLPSGANTSTPLVVQLRSFRNIQYDVNGGVARPKAISGLPPNYVRGTEASSDYQAKFTSGAVVIQASPFADTDLNVAPTAGLTGTIPMTLRVTRSFQQDSAGNPRNYSKFSELLASLTFLSV